MDNSDDQLRVLEQQIQAKLGKKKAQRFRSLQDQTQQALRRNDFGRIRELDVEMEKLVAELEGRPEKAYTPSPAQQLTDLYEAFLRYNEAVSAYQSGDDSSAIEKFEHVLRLLGQPEGDGPTDLAGDAWLGKGVSLARLQRVDEALKCYDRAIEFKPADSRLRRERDRAANWLKQRHG